MHLLDCTRTQVTLPGESAQLAKHCGTCTQSCPACIKWTASQVLRCVHTEMPCPKCRCSRELQYSNSEQAHPDQAQATGRAAGTPGSPTQIGRKRKCTHQAALPGPSSFWPPGSTLSTTRAQPNFNLPAKTIQHTVYTKATFSRL